MEPRSGIRMNDGFLNGVSDFFSLSARSTSKGVTIHMNSLQQYFPPHFFQFFIFILNFLQHFTKWNWKILLSFVFGHLWEWK